MDRPSPLSPQLITSSTGFMAIHSIEKHYFCSHYFHFIRRKMKYCEENYVRKNTQPVHTKYSIIFLSSILTHQVDNCLQFILETPTEGPVNPVTKSPPPQKKNLPFVHGPCLNCVRQVVKKTLLYSHLPTSTEYI